MAAVVADLVEGVLVANQAKLEAPRSETLRGHLLASLEVVEPPARAA